MIAHWDWPEAWPQLLPRLDAALSSGDGSLVHGAMRVLTGTATLSEPAANPSPSEFCRDLSDLQLPGVAPVILPQLVRVLLQPQVRPLHSSLLILFDFPSSFVSRVDPQFFRWSYCLIFVVHASLFFTGSFAVGQLHPLVLRRNR